MDPCPQARLGPAHEPPVRSRDLDPERWRQPPPGTPTGEHVHDRREHHPRIRRSPTTTLRPVLDLGNQGLNQLPQHIKNQPPRQRINHNGRSSRTTGQDPNETRSNSSSTACGRTPKNLGSHSTRSASLPPSTDP